VEGKNLTIFPERGEKLGTRTSTVTAKKPSRTRKKEKSVPGGPGKMEENDGKRKEDLIERKKDAKIKNGERAPLCSTGDQATPSIEGREESPAEKSSP